MFVELCDSGRWLGWSPTYGDESINVSARPIYCEKHPYPQQNRVIIEMESRCRKKNMEKGGGHRIIRICMRLVIGKHNHECMIFSFFHRVGSWLWWPSMTHAWQYLFIYHTNTRTEYVTHVSTYPFHTHTHSYTYKHNSLSYPVVCAFDFCSSVVVRAYYSIWRWRPYRFNSPDSHKLLKS